MPRGAQGGGEDAAMPSGIAALFFEGVRRQYEREAGIKIYEKPVPLILEGEDIDEYVKRCTEETGRPDELCRKYYHNNNI
jgi:hypothetical protein